MKDVLQARDLVTEAKQKVLLTNQEISKHQKADYERLRAQAEAEALIEQEKRTEIIR